MVRCGTCADATWHARPRGSATRTHASACMAWWWRGRVAGPHESTQMPTWRLHGMRWAGWGSNAIALFRPTFYTYQFPSFPPCGTMFPINLFFAGHVAKQGASDEIAWIKVRRSRGLESTRSPSEARAPKRTVDRVSGHRTLEILSRFRRSWATHARIRSFQSRSDR